MADPLSQDKRQVKVTTPLGENALALMQFSGTEGLSELFEFRVRAVSTQGGLDFASALGQGSRSVATCSGVTAQLAGPRFVERRRVAKVAGTSRSGEHCGSGSFRV